ncbi:MAG TPA: DUF4129 domain-containing protein, partial [Acidobacteria bacterium]|nr:DUF4129 domain-containing protein [Acidobacteriota bacterium]
AALEASRILDRLARRLDRSGVEVPPSATPRWIVLRAAERWSELAPVLDELLRLAEQELYGPGAGPGARERLREIRRLVGRRAA